MASVLHWRNQIGGKSFFHVDRLARQFRPFLPPHSHDYAEIFFVENGNGTHEVNGQRQALAGGTLILIRPFIDTHSVRDSDGRLCILQVAVRASSIRFLESRYFGASPFWGGAGTVPAIINLSPHQQGWFQAAARKLAGSPQTRLEVERFVLDLAETLQDSPPHDDSQRLSDWLLRARAGIEDREYFQQGARGFTLLANRSKEHVARELKKRLGKTPTELVNEARMRYAAEKLSRSSVRIIDIAYGVTPRQYRQDARASVAVFNAS